MKRVGLECFAWIFLDDSSQCLRASHIDNQRESQYDLAYLETGVEEHVETERVKTILLQDIHKEIEKLPRQRKTILRLYFFEQKNTTEIAEMMQLSPQTVLNHKTKALDSLRKSGLRLRWLLDGVPGFVLAAAFYLLK